MTISQMKSIGHIGTTRLLGITMALLMIVAVACASGEKANQPAPTETGANPAGSNVEQNQATESNSDGTGSNGSGEIADGSGATASEATIAAEIEQSTGALFLEMIAPDTDELFVTESKYEFTGRTTVDALVSVNDHVLEIDEQGRFALLMDLEEGPNVIEVVASNALGEQFDEVLLVIYEPV